MDDKQGSSSLRRYHLLAHEQADEPPTNRSIRPQMLPISIDASCASASLPHKRRRSSITTESSLSTFLSSAGEREFLYERNPTMTTTRETRKRSAQDDIVTYASHHFLREHEQYTHKRARYESPNSIELENQPPHATLKRRSLAFQQQTHQPDLLPTTWDHHRSASDMPLLFNHLLPTLPRLTTTTAPYHRTNSAPTHEHSLADHYSTLLTEHHHHSSIFHSNSLGASTQKSTIPKPSNGSSPLRTTNFLLDNKQPTIIRTGNISPAHSDSSSESTSTCSSDEQLHHHHYHMHQPQPWRSFRERENYEQLLDLAEKLSDPNRFNQVDVQQFFSYRYKAASPASKQTACVICMSHFKNGQHIRVLPCQHEYHSKCIARWFTMNSSCPICRRDNFLSAC